MQVIQKLTLQNFRCFDFSQFTFEDITYLYGENGCGKTSVIEAVSLLNGQNSFRAKTIDLLAKEGNNAFEIMAETDHGNVFIGYDGVKKNMELDQDSITAQTLKKLFCPVIFAPNHELSLSSNSLTRNFLDKLCNNIFPEHDKLLNKYKELSAERIKILLTNGNKTWLDSIEEQASQTFVTICYHRLSLGQKIQSFMEEISFSGKISILDKHIKLLEDRQTFSFVEKAIREDFLKSRESDRYSGRNSVSINNIEYKIEFRGKSIEFASSGQQKLIGAIFALGTGFHAKNLKPGVIILLDDIRAKIDDKNQNLLLDVIRFVKCQSIISSLESHNDIYSIKMDN